MRSIVASRGSNFNLLFFIILVALLTGFSSFAQTNTWDGSSGDTNWNTAANWSLNVVPTSAHDVVIPDGSTVALRTVTVNTAAVCNSFTVNGGPTDNAVNISLTNSLAVTNGITIGAGGGSGDNKLLNVGTGSLSCASITLTA